MQRKIKASEDLLVHPGLLQGIGAYLGLLARGSSWAILQLESLLGSMDGEDTSPGPPASSLSTPRRGKEAERAHQPNLPKSRSSPCRPGARQRGSELS